MARKFETAAIASTVKAPISKRSLTHINTAWDELGEDIVKGLLGTYTTNDVIVLYGCVVTANIPGTSAVTAGAIFYNGRIYKVDANASISTPSNTLVWSIIETTITGDPATFSDGSAEDFHIIEKFRLTNAATGTGLADYNGATVRDYISISDGEWTTITLLNSWVVGPASGAFIKYKKSVAGKVTIFGSIQSPGTLTTFFTLPSGFRPPFNMALPVIISSGTGFDAGFIQVSTNGNLQIIGTDVMTSTIPAGDWADIYTEFYI